MAIHHKMLFERIRPGCVPTTIELGDLGDWASCTKTKVRNVLMPTVDAVQARIKEV